MTKNLNLLFLSVVLLIGCEKETNYVQSLRKHNTENYADISISGYYNNVALNEKYKLVFTNNHITYSDWYYDNIITPENDSIPTRSFSTILYTEDFNSYLSFGISISQDKPIVNYSFSLLKIYDTNKLLSIDSQNIFTGDQADPIIDYKIENFKYSEESGFADFNIFIHTIIGPATDFQLNGTVHLKIYKKEYYSNPR